MWWHTFSGCDVICNGYYVLNIGDMMSQIHRMWYIPYSACDVIDSVAVMTEICWMPFQIHWGWCHEYSACDVINNVVWCHKIWTWCFAECIWHFTYSGVMSYIQRVLYHWKSGCNDTHSVAVMSYAMGMMSSYIGDEISKIQLVWYHQYSGCDYTYRVDKMSNIAGVMS